MAADASTPLMQGMNGTTNGHVAMPNGTHKDSPGKDHAHPHAHGAPHAHTNFTVEATLILLCTGAIYAAYLTQGVVSELLSTTKYGPQEERFPSLSIVNGAQAVVCFLWSLLLLLLFPSLVLPKSHSQLPPFYAYWRPAITNSVGPALGMIALKNISYSAQVLAKSCKMIPVMLIGAVLHGRRYGALEWACMTGISGGVALFAFKSSAKATSKLAASNPALGYVLCLGNLLLDGYTNAAQDEINRRYKDNSPVHMMCWMNFWVGLYYSVYMALSATGIELVNFCARHPEAAWHLFLFCSTGALGQLVIFFTIKRFGSLVCTMVCTTRKFFNILISVVYQGSSLLPQQWVGVVFVFGGLITTSLAKHAKSKRDAAKKPEIKNF